jgi:hypothetical protein
MVSLTLALAILAADLNIDGVINSRDLTVAFSQWGHPGSADLNRDGVVDVLDTEIVFSLWGAGWGAHATGDGADWFVAPGYMISDGPSPFVGYHRLTFWNKHGDIASIDVLVN